MVADICYLLMRLMRVCANWQKIVEIGAFMRYNIEAFNLMGGMMLWTINKKWINVLVVL